MAIKRFSKGQRVIWFKYDYANIPTNRGIVKSGPDEVGMYRVDMDEGWFWPLQAPGSQLRHESFLRFITRGSGMGLTPWWAAGGAHLSGALLWFFSEDTPSQVWIWVLRGLGLLIASIPWWGAARNYRGKQG